MLLIVWNRRHSNASEDYHLTIIIRGTAVSSIFALHLKKRPKILNHKTYPIEDQTAARWKREYHSIPTPHQWLFSDYNVCSRSSYSTYYTRITLLILRLKLHNTSRYCIQIHQISTKHGLQWCNTSQVMKQKDWRTFTFVLSRVQDMLGQKVLHLFAKDFLTRGNSKMLLFQWISQHFPSWHYNFLFSVHTYLYVDLKLRRSKNRLGMQ